MQAALGQLGWVVNHKKIKRLMREHGLQPPRRRRFVVTTDSDHDQPVFPDRAKELVVDGRNQLWVADLTDVAIAVGFVYVAVIMDAWSRRLVGYALGRRIDARLTLAALDAAIALRRPPPSSVSTTPIAGPNTPLSAIGNASSRADSSARWAGVAIPTTMR
jgi:putative transposase